MNNCEIRQNLDLCVNLFNTVICDMTALITKDFPDDIMLTTYEDIMKTIIKNSPTEPISMFLIYMHKNDKHDKYRKNILLRNDKFFTEINHNENDAQTINIIFRFKRYWKMMSMDLQEYIKSSMCTILKISDKYIKYKSLANNNK